MKAWIVTDNREYEYSTVVFAETRGKARMLAQSTQCCEDTPFIHVQARRASKLDRYYREGKKEMEWDNMKDRVVLVRDAGFSCVNVFLEHCKQCPARKWCNAYEEKIS